MTGPNTHPVEHQEQGSNPALQELYARLSSGEMQTHPDVDAIRAAGEVIRDYFESSTRIDETFKNVVDGTVSVAGALIYRAGELDPANKDAHFGDFNGDETIASALWHAARALDFDSGSHFTTNDADKALNVLHRAKTSAHQGHRSPREHATDELRRFTRKLEKSEDNSVQREYRSIAIASATAIMELAEYGGRNEKIDLGTVGLSGKTGEVPMHKDYIAGHLAASVKAIAKL